MLVILGLGGPTLAANLSLNSNQAIEFGKGRYEISSCQSWINLNIDSGYYDLPTPGSYMNRVFLDNLDTEACSSTLISLSFYDASDNQLSVFGTDPQFNSIEIKIDFEGIVTLVDQDNQPISDTEATISFDDLLGTYEIDLVNPLISMDELSKVGLESRNL